MPILFIEKDISSVFLERFVKRFAEWHKNKPKKSQKRNQI